MAFGRPRRRNDPSVMASVEAATSVVARPGPIARLWHWRYELDRRNHIVVLEVIRRLPSGGPGDNPSGWSYLDLDRGEAGGPGPGETAAYFGPGLPRPYR
jgi:hypothetical protein